MFVDNRFKHRGPTWQCFIWRCTWVHLVPWNIKHVSHRLVFVKVFSIPIRDLQNTGICQACWQELPLVTTQTESISSHQDIPILILERIQGYATLITFGHSICHVHLRTICDRHFWTSQWSTHRTMSPGVVLWWIYSKGAPCAEQTYQYLRHLVFSIVSMGGWASRSQTTCVLFLHIQCLKLVRSL